MGYGVTTKKREAVIYGVMLGLRKPDIASRPYPWQVDREAGNQYLREWRLREWYGWLKERLVFPFHAWVRISERGDLAARPVMDLAPMTAEEAGQLGIYLQVPMEAGDGMIIAGLTNIIPVEIDSPNWGPIAEYQAYRERVGPPPATVGQPAFLRLRSS